MPNAGIDLSVTLQTTIECCVDVNTTDGYKLRLFCIAFTKRRQNQLKKTTYAQTAQIKQIRKKMTDIMTKEASYVPTLARLSHLCHA